MEKASVNLSRDNIKINSFVLWALNIHLAVKANSSNSGFCVEETSSGEFNLQIDIKAFTCVPQSTVLW